VAVLSFAEKPIVLSLMGTDAYGEYSGINKVIFKSRIISLFTFFVQPFVRAIISKSKYIECFVYRKKRSFVIPNGVSLDFFKSISQQKARREIGLDENKKYVLFLGDINYKRKNFELAERVVREVGENDVELLTPYPVPHEKVVYYLNASDVLIHTAFMEGSSNIIKEAMACNCPVVSTDVGDAKWVLADTPGCYITSFEDEDVAEKLKRALDFALLNGKTKGRERILELGLDSASIAKRIVDVYNKVLKETETSNCEDHLPRR
jgi:glycosyltransferase involved in cell wall biosynthesis